MDEKNENRSKAWRDVTRSLTMLFQLGLSAICPILILIIVGLKLDQKFGNGHHWFTVAGVVCGIYASYRGTYLMIRDGWMKDQKETPEEGKEEEQDE